MSSTTSRRATRHSPDVSIPRRNDEGSQCRTEIPRYAQDDIWRRDIHLMCHPEEERRGISVLDPSLRSGEIPRYARNDIFRRAAMLGRKK